MKGEKNLTTKQNKEFQKKKKGQDISRTEYLYTVIREDVTERPRSS